MDPDDLDLVRAHEVPVGRILGLGGSELLLRRERDARQVFHPLDLLGPDAGLLELAAVERRAPVAARELLGEPLLLEPARPRGRHRLDAFIEVPRPGRHAGLA
jgi:hypothetical protein